MTDANGAQPDIIISGGPILTMDRAGSRPEAVAVRNGQIITTGSLAEVIAHQGPATHMLNLDGRTLLPG